MARAPVKDEYIDAFNKAACNPNPTTPAEQLARNIYMANNGMPGSDAAERKKEEEEEKREEGILIAHEIDHIMDALTFNYDNKQFQDYNDFTNSRQWQDFADKKIDDWSTAAGTTVIVSPDGKVYYGVTGADGNQEYYRVNDNGTSTRVFDTNQELQDIPDGAETFDALAVGGAGNTLYKQVNERGETEYVNRHGEKVDDATVQKAEDALAKAGRTLEGSTISYEDWKNANRDMDAVHVAEAGDGDAQDNLKAAETKLAQNYTPENFINREMKKVAALQAGIDAKRASSTALSMNEDNKLLEDETKLAEDRQKLEKLQSDIAGKSPEEANKIMAAAFGDKYNTLLAQQTVEKQQNALAASAPENTSRAPSSYASQFDPATDKLSSRSAFAAAADPNAAPIAPAPKPQAPAITPQQQFSLS